MVFKFDNGYIRNNIAELFPAGKGHSGFGIQGADDLAAVCGFRRGQTKLSGNGWYLIFGNHFQALTG